MTLERDIEAYFVRRVKGIGGEAYKFTSPSRRNVPDRLVLYPGGFVEFVELKSPGKKATAGQLREHQRLLDMGFPVFVLDSRHAVDIYISSVEDR
jgi:hypothetical protein